MMSSRLTLEQIGELANVSSSTVSRVINGHPSVRREVRERVQQVIAETGYRPHPAARTLAGQKSRIIGLIIPETSQILFTDPYFPRLIQGVAQACQSHDYTLSLFIFHVLDDETKLSTRVLQTQLVDGLILAATHISDPLVDRLLESRMPFVMVGQHQDGRVSFVDADNQAGAYAAVSHLLRLGYQRVGHIAGPPSNLAAIHRQQGYLDALRDRGRALDKTLIINGDYTEAGGYYAMERLLPRQPDALFVASDTMAQGVLRFLTHVGRRVPDDIAVVGYDDLPGAALTTPPLTSVRQPIKRAGVLVAETLIDMLEYGVDPPRRIMLPTELIVRTSCGAGGGIESERR